MSRTFIAIKTNFEAIHCWPECPIEDVAFLKNPHRHIFYVEMKWETTGDRQIEFIRQKREVENYIDWHLRGKDLGSMSCEAIAEKLAKMFEADFVTVWEDNENGAIYVS